MLAAVRTDQVPPYHKDRHVHSVSKNKYVAKKIFRNMTEENDLSIRQALEYDTGFLELREITNDANEDRLILKHATINYSMLTEIYHYLQCRSKAYPWIDTLTLHEQFIKEMDIISTDNSPTPLNLHKFEVLMAQICYTNGWEERVESRWVKKPNGISRYLFMDMLIRIAKVFYSTPETLTAAQIEEMKLNIDANEQL